MSAKKSAPDEASFKKKKAENPQIPTPEGVRGQPSPQAPGASYTK